MGKSAVIIPSRSKNPRVNRTLSRLLRDEDIELVKASKNSTGIMNPNNLKQGVQIKVDEFIKDFVRDYRKANGQEEHSEGDEVMV